MYTCLCGNAIDQQGVLCPRCKALQTLGLEPHASGKEVASAYRMMVKVWHPDRFQSDPKLKAAADEKLKAINAAHDYLSAHPEAPRRQAPSPPPPRPQQTTTQRTANQGTATRGTAENSYAGGRPRPFRKRSIFLDPALVAGILMRGVVLACSLAFSAAILFGMDSWLSRNSATASIYRPYRSGLLRSLHIDAERVEETAEQDLHRLVPWRAKSDAESASAASDSITPADAGSKPNPPTPHIPMPYVTVGLTRDEVIGVMGTPASTTAGTVLYKQAVFYFKNGVVSGWKIDRSLIPLRVKLWPQGHVDPSITTFTVDSPKDVVIAVQGTPTMLSATKLGYGSSEVFLENGRVVGWHDDHSSEPLRTAPK
jgi:hypothetical protein